jgi:hypothetical protein
MSNAVYNSDRPWERQPCDDDFSWSLFQEYLNQLAPRYLARLVKGRTFELAAIDEMARRGAWKARAASYDAWIDENRMAAYLEARTGQASVKAELAFRCERIASNELRKQEQISFRSDIPALKLSEILALVNLYVELDAEAGVDTQPVADLSQFSTEELQTFRELLMKAEKNPR